MSSIIWYIYEFARKTWIDGFFDAKSREDIAQKPERFRDFPKRDRRSNILWPMAGTTIWKPAR